MGELFGVKLPLPQSFLDKIYQKVADLLNPILSPVRALVGIFTHFTTVIPDTFKAGTHLTDSIIKEYQGFKNFSFRQGGNTRVIQSVRGFEQLSRLIVQIPTEVAEKIKDMIAQIRGKLDAAPIQDVLEDLEGLEDLRSVVKKFGPKFGQAFEKVFGVLALLLDSFATIRRTIDDLQTIVDDVRELRESVTQLKGIVLPQDNKRKRVYLEDGTFISRRVGRFTPE